MYHKLHQTYDIKTKNLENVRIYNFAWFKSKNWFCSRGFNKKFPLGAGKCDATPDSISTLSVIAKLPNLVEVRWQISRRGLTPTSFKIHHRKVGEEQWYFVFVPGYRNVAVITNVKPETTYEVNYCYFKGRNFQDFEILLIVNDRFYSSSMSHYILSGTTNSELEGGVQLTPNIFVLCCSHQPKHGGRTPSSFRDPSIRVNFTTGSHHGIVLGTALVKWTLFTPFRWPSVLISNFRVS